MQAEPIATTTNVPPTETSDSPTITTQDGFHPPAQSSLSGSSSCRSPSLSLRVAADGDRSPASRVEAEQHDDNPRLLSDGEQCAILPGDRISAYENAITPTAPQTMGFKVVKRSGSVTDGPTLTDCPNGMWPQKEGRV